MLIRQISDTSAKKCTLCCSVSCNDITSTVLKNAGTPSFIGYSVAKVVLVSKSGCDSGVMV